MDTKINTSVKVCIFCKNMGISQPHNHTIRDFSKKNAPIICPNLLATKCTYCKQQGHTKRYCTLLQRKIAPNDTPVNKCKRLHNSFDDSCPVIPTKSQKIGELVAAVSTMDMDINNS